jgi:hypothetical protein
MGFQEATQYADDRIKNETEEFWPFVLFSVHKWYCLLLVVSKRLTESSPLTDNREHSWRSFENNPMEISVVIKKFWKKISYMYNYTCGVIYY